MAELADMPDKVFMSVRSMQAIDKAIAERDVKTVLEASAIGRALSRMFFTTLAPPKSLAALTSMVISTMSPGFTSFPA